MQAIEIALGDTLESDGRKRQAISDQAVERQARLFRRTLAELDPGTSVQELIEALDE